MKITRKQLRKIIKEEWRPHSAMDIGGKSLPAHPREDLGKNIADVDFPIVVGYEGKSEVVYDQDSLDELLDYLTRENDIAYSLDSLEDAGIKDIPVGRDIEMYGESLNKKQIRKIIRETVMLVKDDDGGAVFGNGGSARMAKGQLFQIGRMAQSLHDKLNDDDEIPEWVQSKIAVIEDNMDAVADHLGYKLYRSDINDPVDS